MATGEFKEKVDLYNKIYGKYIDVANTENTVASYEKLAAEYENDFVGLGYETPKEIAAEAVKYLQLNDAYVLDVACGTGLVGEALRSCNFSGLIDGIDGSKSMLELAQKRGIYKNLMEVFIYLDKPMPYSDNQFDAVVCSGGFGPGHLEPAVLKDLIRVVKYGGCVVFATRVNILADAYVQKLNLVIAELENQNFIKKENCISTTYFGFDATASKNNEIKPVDACIYTLRKCK